MNTASIVHPANSASIRFFGGVVSGLSAAMITSSLLYLLWFIPLGRPGSHIQTVEEIVPTLKAAGDARPDAELRTVAEGVRSRQESMAVFYHLVEILILTSTCLVAAYFAALYGRAHDQGDGRNGGTLMLPTLIGTVAGAVVLWLLFNVLVASPAAAHPQHHAPSAVHPAMPQPTPSGAVAAHGSQAPANPPRAEAVHDDHAPKDWSSWLAENGSIAQLIAYLLGTIAAAAVGVLAPRGGGRTTKTVATPDGHNYAPAH
jgi:hypothetical protein